MASSLPGPSTEQRVEDLRGRVRFLEEQAQLNQQVIGRILSVLEKLVSGIRVEEEVVHEEHTETTTVTRETT